MLRLLNPLALRAVMVVGVVLACLLLVAPWAVLTARTEATFGPHMAVYSITTDATITVDLGPVGSLRVPAADRLPLGMGVHVDVEEIPDRLAIGGTTLDALGADIASYATFFAAPEAQIEVVTRGLITDAIARELGAGLGLAAVIGVLLILRGPPVRTRRSRQRTTIGLAAGTALVCLLAVLLVPAQRQQPIVANPAFDGTALEGAQVTGRLSGVMDEVIRLVSDFIAANDAFYDSALASIDITWDGRPSAVERPPVPGQVPPPGPSRWADGSLTTAVFGTDIHCNAGMTRVVADVVERSGADLYIDGGDITMTGTPAENYCIDSLAHALPDGLPKVFIKGNHDSLDTESRAASTGWTVLQGDTVEVAGLRIFGDGDPRRTVFGQPGPELETGETGPEFTARMTAEACEAEVDIVLVHDPRHIEPALTNGCADFALNGHWHRQVGPEQFGQGIRYVSSTTGGALANALTPGPLKMPAEFTIIRFDSRTGDPIELQVLTVGMDATVSYSDWLPVPRPGPWAPEVPWSTAGQ